MAKKVWYGFLVGLGVLAMVFVGQRVLFNNGHRNFDRARTAEFFSAIEPVTATEKLPNMVVILADDMGYGDLGCYVAKAIRTPNIDRMAEDGVLMTNFYAAMPSCSPSRAAILTGRYPIRAHVVIPFFHSQTTMTGFLNHTNAQLPLPLKLLGKVMPINVLMKLMDRYQYGITGIPEDEALLPEILHKRGYRTALVGKWHLGDKSPSLPNENGFDFFYGSYCSNDTPFGCIARKYTYCCFKSKLGRIIHEQGRPQIDLGWGEAKRPECRGFTPEELVSLDFAAIDFSEFYADALEAAESVIRPSEAEMSRMMEERIRGMMP